jgi:hypothetical protein
MAVIVKVQAIWEGFQGAPGYTNWYGLSDGDAAAAANALAPRMRTFFAAIQIYMPTVATVKVQRLYQVIDSLTGHLTGEANLTADPAVVAGGSATAYAAPVGAVVNWETGMFNDLGHRVRGRSYLVPLAGCFQTNGTIQDSNLAAIQAAGTAAIGGLGGLVVYSRPRKADPIKGTPAQAGVVNTVTAAIVKDKACVLRSRRD